MVPVPSNDQNGSDGSNEIITCKNSSSFSTTIEYFKGSQLLYQVTHSLITSLTRSRIDTNAFSASLKIGRALNWSNGGKDRFRDAKNGLGLVSSYERLLQFGFTWKGPVSQLLELDEGERFAALTACLVEIYTPNFVAEIYTALLRLFVDRNKDDEFFRNMCIPSRGQMRSVIERFAGILSTSPFATSVEDYLSLDDHDVVTGGAQTRRTQRKLPKSRTVAFPDFIAAALYELLEISRDGSKTQQVQFVGGADAVVLAAIGRYLIDTSTEVYKESNGSVVNVTSPELKSSGKPRVIVLFAKENFQNPNTTQLTQARVVHLYQMTDIIKENKYQNPDSVLAGRCEWRTVLSMTFGCSFERLTKGMHSQFASALGCAARVFQALAEGDESLSHSWLVACRTYTDSSFGPDYVNFAMWRFPELKNSLSKIEQDMQGNARLSYGEAEKLFEESIANISMLCRCKICWLERNRDPKGHTSTLGTRTGSREWYCLTALATTIIRLIRVLSGIDIVDKELCLSRKGVEWFYNQQKMRHQRQRQIAKTTTNKRDELYVTRILDYARIDKAAPEFSSLAVALTLFSGEQRQEDLPYYTSAFHAQGICAYLRILEQPCRDAKRVARICVIPGCINFNDNPYGGIQDLGFDPFRDTQKFAKSDLRPDYCVPEKARKIATDCASKTSKDMKLCVRERLDDFILPVLEVGFSLSRAEGDVLEWLGPARAVENITRGTGLTTCHSARCDHMDSVEEELKKIIPSGSPTRNPFEVFKWGDTQAFIFRGDTPTALIAACGCWLPMFLTESNCVKCAIQTGMRNSWKNVAIVCSERSLIDVSICCTHALCMPLLRWLVLTISAEREQKAAGSQQ